MATSSTEEKIFNSAKIEFAKFGLAGARVDSIAGRAKINKAMIYYYYKGKEKLYEHILLSIVEGIYNTVKNLIPDKSVKIEDLEKLIRGYAEYIGRIDEDYIRIMIREIASGGKYFKKITVPKLIEPVMDLVIDIFKKGQKEGIIDSLNPQFTMIQIIGSIVFFNLMRITLKDTPIYYSIFKGNFISDYIDNLLHILKFGIFKPGGAAKS
jgi:TetR/AcrR family transcriptional regulator